MQFLEVVHTYEIWDGGTTVYTILRVYVEYSFSLGALTIKGSIASPANAGTANDKIASPVV